MGLIEKRNHHQLQYFDIEKSFANELHLANCELVFQNEEKEKRAAELLVANKELQFQNQEKENRASELALANIELRYQSIEKSKRAGEFILAQKELAYQNVEKEKRIIELNFVNQELKKAEEYQLEYIHGLEEIMFMTSHNIRLQIANIIGISDLLYQSLSAPEETELSITYLKQSALSLQTFTKELTLFVVGLEQKGKSNQL